MHSHLLWLYNHSKWLCVKTSCRAQKAIAAAMAHKHQNTALNFRCHHPIRICRHSYPIIKITLYIALIFGDAMNVLMSLGFVRGRSCHHQHRSLAFQMIRAMAGTKIKKSYHPSPRPPCTIAKQIRRAIINTIYCWRNRDAAERG